MNVTDGEIPATVVERDGTTAVVEGSTGWGEGDHQGPWKSGLVTVDEHGCWGIDGQSVAWPHGTRLREFDGDVVLETPDGAVLGEGINVLIGFDTGRTVTAGGLAERCGADSVQVVRHPSAR